MSFLLIVSGLRLLSAASDERTVQALAASPERIAQGRVWLLISSGLLVERPFAASLVDFAFLGTLTLALCRRRIFWYSALGRHVGSALLACASVVPRASEAAPIGVRASADRVRPVGA